MDKEFPEKSKSELMADILNATGFNLMKIIRFDINNKLIFEDMTLDRTWGGIEQAAFSFSSLEKIISLLSSTRNTVLFTNPLTSIGQVAYKKINVQFVTEVFVPLFTGSSNVAGILYMAKQSGDPELPRSDIYINSMRLLIFILERELHASVLQDKLNKTVLLLCEIVNAKEPMMMSNAYAVLHWSVRIARQMRLPEKEIQKLQLVALMHNLGKIYIDELKLSDGEDRDVSIQRTERSYELALRLGRIYELEDIPEIILHIQERVDGTGYPGGLCGDEIPLLSRILCVAKAITAMYANKPNRKTKALDEIVDEVKANAGTQFDAGVANAALALLIDKRYENADFFSGMGNYATLSMTIDRHSDNTIQLFGQVRRIQNLHVFYPLEKMPSIEARLVSKSALYMDVNERILQFDVEIKQFLPDRVLLSSVEPRRMDDMFSVLWYMEGVLITNEKSIHNIYINLLGGDYMDFYILSDKSPTTSTGGIVKLALKENADTYLPGIITFRQTINDKTFYRFKYTNVSEADRQAVFSAMFRKQLEMRARITRTIPQPRSDTNLKY